MMIREKKLIWLIVFLLLLGACAPVAELETTEPPLPTLTNTALPATETPVPTATATNTAIPPTATATQTLVPTATVTPHPGFSNLFKFYQAWTFEDITYFYFMNAYVDDTIYAIVDDLEGKTYPLTCPLDQTYPQDLRCYSEELFKGKKEYKVTFFADPERQYPFYEEVVETKLDETYLTYDNCEAEYRIYDGKCYSAMTCYDDDGNVVYSYDNIPDTGNFEGFTVPCP